MSQTFVFTAPLGDFISASHAHIVLSGFIGVSLHVAPLLLTLAKSKISASAQPNSLLFARISGPPIIVAAGSEHMWLSIPRRLLSYQRLYAFVFLTAGLAGRLESTTRAEWSNCSPISRGPSTEISARPPFTGSPSSSVFFAPLRDSERYRPRLLRIYFHPHLPRQQIAVGNFDFSSAEFDFAREIEVHADCAVRRFLRYRLRHV